MHVATQFSIFMVNKPGVLAQVLREFAEAKINICAITMMDSVEHGVLCVTLTNQSGALATVAEKLARSHINISYAYCTAGAKGGRTTGILKVANVAKAMKVLEQSNKKNSKSRPLVRRPKSSRK